MCKLTPSGLNRDLYTGDISYIPLVSPTEWQVSLDGIKVNGVDVAVAVDPPPARPPTAHIQLPHDNIWIKEALLHIVMGQIPGATWLLSSNNDIVYHVPCSITSTITFRLGGKEYTVPAWAWVMPDYVGTGRCMSQIMSTRVADPSSLSSVVLGQPFLMTVYTAFKVAESPQIGFVPLSEAALNVETEYVERLGAQPSGTIPGHATGGNTATPAPIGSAGTGSAAPNAAGDGTRAAASGLGPPSNAATRAALSAALLVAAFTITVALGA